MKDEWRKQMKQKLVFQAGGPSNRRETCCQVLLERLSKIPSPQVFRQYESPRTLQLCNSICSTDHATQLSTLYISSKSWNLKLPIRDFIFFGKLFFFSLLGPALTWFKNLPSWLINSFTTLYNNFICQYSSNQGKDEGPNSLFSLKQQPRGKLRSFIIRF